MNHETAVAMAAVLAVLVMSILYTLVTGGIGIGETGVGNISDRAEQDGSGMNLDFSSYENGQNQPNLVGKIENSETQSV
jgi:hypothetical protein